jgi:hypothetical protein
MSSSYRCYSLLCLKAKPSETGSNFLVPGARVLIGVSWRSYLYSKLPDDIFDTIEVYWQNLNTKTNRCSQNVPRNYSIILNLEVAVCQNLSPYNHDQPMTVIEVMVTPF